MPKDYLKRKRKLLAKGVPLKQAKEQAAIRTNVARKRQGRPAARFHR